MAHLAAAAVSKLRPSAVTPSWGPGPTPAWADIVDGAQFLFLFLSECFPGNEWVSNVIVRVCEVFTLAELVSGGTEIARWFYADERSNSVGKHGAYWIFRMGETWMTATQGNKTPHPGRAW